MKIGFIGLGAMGRGMAANLQKAGYDLVVSDLTQAAAAPFLEKGATWAETPRAVAAGCDVVFTSLPTPAIVEAVFGGDDGLAAGFAKGATWFDLTTNSVHVVRALHDKAAALGVTLLDAPISGGPTGAASGKLAILVGGDKAAFDRYQPVLDAMADKAQYIGEIGAGTIVKLSHNLASTAIKAVVAEVLTMGVRAGMEPLTLWQAMRSGVAGRARSFDNVTRFLEGQIDPPSFALNLLKKDIGLALDMAREHGIEMPMCSHLEQDIETALARGWGDRDAQAILLLSQERAGIAPIKLSKEDVSEVIAKG